MKTLLLLAFLYTIPRVFSSWPICSDSYCLNEGYCYRMSSSSSLLRVPTSNASFLETYHDADIYSCGCPIHFAYENCTQSEETNDKRNASTPLSSSSRQIVISTHCEDQDTEILIETIYSESQLIVIDHGVFGRPLKLSHSSCSAYDYASSETEMCVLPNTLSLLTYWCNGKTSCAFYKKYFLSYGISNFFSFFIIQISVNSYQGAISLCKDEESEISRPRNLQDFLDIYEQMINLPAFHKAYWISADTLETLDTKDLEVFWIESSEREKENQDCIQMLHPEFLAKNSFRKLEVRLQRRSCEPKAVVPWAEPICSKPQRVLSQSLDFPCLKGLSYPILEYRFHFHSPLTPRNIYCGAHVKYRRGNTCYTMTQFTTSWWLARQECWSKGGELAFPLSSDSSECSLPIIIQDPEEMWIAGRRSCCEERCAIPLDSPLFEVGAVDKSNDLCFVDSFLASDTRSRRGLCALPPLFSKRPFLSTPQMCDLSTINTSNWPYDTYVWNTTGFEGELLSQPCPCGQLGFATWKCETSGIWINFPDLSNCTTLNLNEYLNALNANNSIPSLVLSYLFEEIREKALGSGDVPLLLSFLTLALDVQKLRLEVLINSSSSSNFSTEFTFVSLQITNELLRRIELWIGVSDYYEKRTLINNLQMLTENITQSTIMTSLFTPDKERVFDFSSLSVVIRRDIEEKETLNFKSSSITMESRGDKEKSMAFTDFFSLECIFNNKNSCDKNSPMSNFINSDIVGATVYENQGNVTLSENLLVTISLTHHLSGFEYNLSNPRCVYWNSVNFSWSSDGCNLLDTSDEKTTCVCSHLTNFAILMDFNGILEGKIAINALLKWITIIGCTLSLLCCSLSLFLYTCVLKSSEQNIIHKNLALSLLLCQTCLLGSTEITKETSLLCGLLTGVLQYSFLSAFSWMLIEGIHIYYMLVKVFTTESSHVKFYYIFGYGVPALLTGASVAIGEFGTSEGYVSFKECWLNHQNGLIWTFVGPVILVLFINAGLFVLALIIAHRSLTYRASLSYEDSKLRQKRGILTWARGSLSLLSILGLSWILGLCYPSSDFEWMSIFFVSLNSLQGVFMFLFHICLNEKAVAEIRRYVSRLQLRHHQTANHEKVKANSNTPSTSNISNLTK